MNELLAAGWGMGLAAQAEGEPRFLLKARSVFPPSGQGRVTGSSLEAHINEGEPVFYQSRTMTRQEVSIEDAIAYLNELLALDAKAMGAMIGSGMPCNDALRDHPTALVLATGPTGSNARIGILGLLNGLFGVRDDGLGEISAVFESNKPVRFERTPPKVDSPETVTCE
jgi:hypothetical protein